MVYHKIRELLLNALNKTPLEAPVRKIYGTFVRTKGNQYDRQTFELMHKALKTDSCCIDIGAYRGEILREILKAAPLGKHYGFEPIPENYRYLKQKFPLAFLYNLALSDEKGKTTFQYVVGRAARSGFLKVDYPDVKQQVTQIEVLTDRLDNIIPKQSNISLIKIDVEGAELKVLKGSRAVISRNKPLVIFEHDKKAKAYKTSTNDIYEFFNNLGMTVCLIKDYLVNDNAKLTKEEMSGHVEKGTETYFLAHANDKATL